MTDEAHEPDAPGRRWPVVVVSALAGLAVAVAVVAFVGGDDDQAVVSDETTTTSTTSTTTTSSPASTSAPVFQAPPRQDPVTTTTQAATTTSTTSTTAAPATSSTTTTRPPSPVLADPGPQRTSEQGNHTAMADAIANARARWEAQVHDGYVFRTERICFCPRAVNDISVSAAGRVEGQTNIEGDREQDPPTVADVFDLLEQAVEDDAHLIEASFDRRFGYPVEIFIDREELLADEEQGREIRWMALRDT